MLSQTYGSSLETVNEEDIGNLQRGAVLSLTMIYEIISKMGKEEILQILKSYVKVELIINKIEENMSLEELTALLLWLDTILEPLNIYIADVFPFPDVETDEILFIGVELKGCNSRDTWSDLCKSIKGEMRKEGFKDLVGEVGLICHQ